MSKGNMLTELRRSNAAGIHDHKPSRSQSRRIAIEEGLDMPSFGEDTGEQEEENSEEESHART